MVNRKELENMYKIKILLKGATGTGKTMTCVKIAKYVASHGYKVLFLDFERGSIDELLKLDDDVLVNIVHKDFATYKELFDYIVEYHKNEEFKLIVIDQMPLKEIARLSARDVYVKQGFYYIGEKKKIIAEEEEDSFDLRGFMYQLPNTWLIKFMNDLVRCNQDLICTLMTPNKYENEYDGKFSTIVEMFVTYVGQSIIWKAIPKKMRGIDLGGYPPIVNPWESLLIPFIKKYGTKDEIEEAKREMEERKSLMIKKKVEQQAIDIKKSAERFKSEETK